MEIVKFGKILKKRIWIVVLCVLIACIATAVYRYYFVSPMYQASTKLIVNKSQDNFLPGQPLNLNDINVNILLINTYKEIIHSRAIMDQVVANHPELHLNAEQLINKVDVNSVDKTQVMTLTVKDFSYEKAAMIVNAVSNVFQNAIPKIMDIDNVQLLNAAQLDSTPSPLGMSQLLSIAISIIASLMFSVGLIFLLEYLDDTIKTEQEVASILGLPTYAAIRSIKTKDLSPHRRKKIKKRMEDAPYASIQ